MRQGYREKFRTQNNNKKQKQNQYKILSPKKKLTASVSWLQTLTQTQTNICQTDNAMLEYICSQTEQWENTI